jgi:S1-C subfamily serine protease
MGMSQRSIRCLLVGVAVLAGFAGIGTTPTLAQEAETISPEMTEAQVRAILGPPFKVRTLGDFSYYFYDNECDECGRDLVIFQDGAVVNCVFSHPSRVYTGVSSLQGLPEELWKESEAAIRPVVYADRAVASGNAEHVPEVAKRLIVHVIGYFEEGLAEQLGAGIIFGADDERIYIVTADHVLRFRGSVAEEVRVAFRDNPQELVAAERDTAHPQLDLAVVSVPREWVRAFEDGAPGLDRLGNVNALKTGDPVTPMGCPNGECWSPPTTPDRVFAKGQFSLSFETVSITTGYSGGGLFNEWWEVVGMITAREGQIARADAIPIGTALDAVSEWDYPTQLRKPSVPRGGYRSTIEMMFLSSGDSGGLQDDRFPSARLTYSHMLRPNYGWHVGGLRLAPENLSLMAAVGGLSARLRTGRFAARPFVEIGYGRMEGRYDAGGYFIDDGEGVTYVPIWNTLETEGLGAGLGIDLEFLVVPHVMLEFLGGYWWFDAPEEAPPLPDIVFGAGLRFGI